MAIEAARNRRMADFEAYALGEAEAYDGSAAEAEEKQLREKLADLQEQLVPAEEEAGKYARMPVHEAFPVLRLTEELLDAYVEDIVVGPGVDEVRVVWK